MKQKLNGTTFGAILLLISVQAAAAPEIPNAESWSVAISTVVNRGSPPASASITDLQAGVNLHFEAETGGFGIGTTASRFEFTTSASASGVGTISLDIRYSAFLGFFLEDYGLQVIRNGSVVHDLIADTFNGTAGTINRNFTARTITIASGDTWGIRTLAGNFTACCGYSGNVQLTLTPVPTTGFICGNNLVEPPERCDGGANCSPTCK